MFAAGWWAGGVVPRPIGLARYETAIARAAARHGVEPALVRAVIRVESGGNPSVRSGRGAVGLMQVQPATADEIAKDLGMDVPVDLTDPERNIEVGVAHLGRLLERFHDAPELALAAYNAGERRVREWIADVPELSAGEAIERTGARETRLYVRRVLAFAELER